MNLEWAEVNLDLPINLIIFRGASYGGSLWGTKIDY